MSEIDKIATRVIGKYSNLYITHGPSEEVPVEMLIRAVLEAIREPTTDMMNAGTRALALDWDICCDGRIAPDLWQRMIDELLK